MSNENDTKPVAVPLIAPGAEPHILGMLRESAKTHEKTIELCESLAEKLEETDRPQLTSEETELIIDALYRFANEREDDIEKLEAGIAELEKAAG